MYQISEVQQMLNAFPREQLGFFPTPFYRLDRISDALGVNLFIKRDDFTGMNLFGGNKVRKLEYLIGEAKASGCEYAITYGATQSNHAMETAAACRRCGIKPILYLTAVVSPDQNDIRSNLLLDNILGAEIHVVNIREGESEIEASLRAYAMGAEQARKLTASGHRCADIPMGGANRVGSLGFVQGFIELQEQLDAANLHMDAIFHATGSGGTLAGLTVGRKLLGSETEIISITASDHDPADYIPPVEQLSNQVLQMLGADCFVDGAKDIHVDNGFYMPGYEQPSEASSEAIRMMAQLEGLFLDPVYTGKAFAAILAYARNQSFGRDSNVLFWHTGGATALFAESQILGQLF